MLRRVSDETQMPLNRLNPDVPKWLSDAVDKLLDKEPSGRYQTAAEVAEVFASGLAEMHLLSPLDVPAEMCAGSRTATVRKRDPICWKKVGCKARPWAGGAAMCPPPGRLHHPRWSAVPGWHGSQIVADVRLPRVPPSGRTRKEFVSIPRRYRDDLLRLRWTCD